MDEISVLLRALQHGDSGFPSGIASFSWGLETLLQDGLVRDAGELEKTIEDQIRRRWAPSDRPALAASWACAENLDEVAACDWIVESQTPASELRSGSRRAGGATLSIHARLGTPGADHYRQRVRAQEAPGHLVVVQGFLWRMLGLPQRTAEAMSAASLSWGLASVAVRLGKISHTDAQRIVTRMEAVIEDVMRVPAPPIAEMHAFTPASEIAAMRHERSEVRLFSN